MATPTIHIIYYSLFDPAGERLKIGGIETYLINLSKLFIDHGYAVSIYQLGSIEWKRTLGGATVFGIRHTGALFNKFKSSTLLKAVEKRYEEGDVVIWGTYSIAVPSPISSTISIQHGISIDYIPSSGKFSKLIDLFGASDLYKWLQRRKSLHHYRASKRTVLVDYNFQNWVRTMIPGKKLGKMRVIPNFTHISHHESINYTSSEPISIVFARRFSATRGVPIAIDIARNILRMHPATRFTFAGEGELEIAIRRAFADDDRVEVTHYDPRISLPFHSSHHISIIPTCGSEGTSLSLLEAMTSGCVPIASNVGGMTNIILDGFNGYLVEPNVAAFTEKIDYLIKNKTERLRLSTNAKRSVDDAFNYDAWGEKWIGFLQESMMAQNVRYNGWLRSREPVMPVARPASIFGLLRPAWW